MALLALLGVFLCALGTVVNTSGMLCMKRASLSESHLPFYLRRFFWLGIFLVILNATAFDLIVYAVAPLGLIAPVSSLTVVWGNVFASRGWITGDKEDVNSRVVWANSVIIGGIILTTTFGPRTGDLPSPEVMAQQLRTAGVRVYALGALTAIGISVVRLFSTQPPPAAGASASVSASSPASPSSVPSGSGGGGGGGGGGEGGAAVTANFLFPLASALCASLSVVSFKAVAIYLARYLSSSLPPDLGVVLALSIAIALAILNAVLLNAGMERSQASYLVSTYQALVVIFTIVAGGLFYDEFAQLEDGGLVAGFVTGVAIAIGGIGWLSYLQPTAGENNRQTRRRDYEELELSEPEGGERVEVS